MKEVPHEIDRYLTRRDALKSGVGYLAGFLGAAGTVLGGAAFGTSYIEMPSELVAEEVAKGKTKEDVLRNDAKSRHTTRVRGAGAFLLGVPALIGGLKVSNEADRTREQFGFDDFVEFIKDEKYSAVHVTAKTTERYGRAPEQLRFGMQTMSFSTDPKFSGYLLETTMVASADGKSSLGYTQENKYQYAETKLRGENYTHFLYELELRNLLTAHERAGILMDRLPGVSVTVQVAEGLSEDEQVLRLQEALALGLKPFPMYVGEKDARNLPDEMVGESMVGPK